MSEDDLKFTPEKRKEYLEHIRSGKTKNEAAALVGLNRKTIYGYCKRHRDFGGAVRNADPKYFSPEKRRRYLALLLEGQTKSGAADMVGISKHIVLKYEREHPKVAATFKWAREVAIQTVADSLYAKAVGGDVAAMRLFLTNMTRNADESRGEMRWFSDSSKVEMTGSNGGPIETYALTREERLERLKAITEEVQSEISSSEGLPKLDQIIKKEEEKE